VQEALNKYLADRIVLVVLDNCEHLIHACARMVTALLQAGSQLKILASSREPLREPGEANLPADAARGTRGERFVCRVESMRLRAPVRRARRCRANPRSK
jgi:predicted ATPase